MGFVNPKRNIEQFKLEPGMEVADFGAGAGYLAVEAASAVGDSGTIYVIDIQQDLLTKATHYAKEQHQNRIVYIHSDLEKENGSTLHDDSVDAVVISNLLFQVGNKTAVLKEALRIVRSGGKLLLVDWRESYSGMGPQPEYVLREDEAKELLATVGFEYLADIDAGAYHYGVICKKHV